MDKSEANNGTALSSSRPCRESKASIAGQPYVEAPGAAAPVVGGFCRDLRHARDAVRKLGREVVGGQPGPAQGPAAGAAQLAKTAKGVRTTVVCPYYIDTGMFAGVATRLTQPSLASTQPCSKAAR